MKENLFYRGTVIILERPPLYALATNKEVSKANVPITISGKCFVLLKDRLKERKEFRCNLFND